MELYLTSVEVRSLTGLLLGGLPMKVATPDELSSTSVPSTQ